MTEMHNQSQLAVQFKEIQRNKLITVEEDNNRVRHNYLILKDRESSENVCWKDVLCYSLASSLYVIE